MEDASVDAVVTDPPAAISFMGREWDSNRGGRDRWIAWLAERMEEACRVLKPGGHALAMWALPAHFRVDADSAGGRRVRQGPGSPVPP